MRIVFLGTPDWSIPTLRALAQSPHTITLVVTQPEKRRDRRSEPSASPVSREAARLALTAIAPTSVKTDAFFSRLLVESPDLIVVVAYGRILPRRVLEAPRLGCVNLHFSLLPRFRGAAPVQWAIVQGETETGVTTMRIVEALDAGPVLLQERTPIGAEEHAPALGDRLAEMGAGLVLRTIEGLANGTLEPREQQSEHASLAPLLRQEDGWIDWAQSAEAIARRVRGFDPWPGQACRSEKGRLKILRARAAPDRSPEASPGLVMGAGTDALRIAAGKGSVLEAALVQPEGRRAMTGTEALRGRHVRAGERLAS